MGGSIRGRIVSVCVSPEGWTVCFNDVCSCNVERWIYVSSILPHLDCIRINCTTSKLLFTFLLFLLLLLLLLLPLDIHCLVFRSVFVYTLISAAPLWSWHYSKVSNNNLINALTTYSIIYSTIFLACTLHLTQTLHFSMFKTSGYIMIAAWWFGIHQLSRRIMSTGRRECWINDKPNYGSQLWFYTQSCL